LLLQASNNNIDIQINPYYTNNKEYLSKDELLQSMFKENKENILHIKEEEKNLEYIDKNFLLFIDKKIIDNNKDNYYNKHLIYGDKKFYLMTILKNEKFQFCFRKHPRQSASAWTWNKFFYCKCQQGHFFILNYIRCPRGRGRFWTKK